MSAWCSSSSYCAAVKSAGLAAHLPLIVCCCCGCWCAASSPTLQGKKKKLAALDTWSLRASGWHTASEEEGGGFPGREERRGEETAYAERGAARQKGRREEGRWSAAGDREANGIAIYASLSPLCRCFGPLFLMCCAFAFYLAGSSVSFPCLARSGLCLCLRRASRAAAVCCACACYHSMRGRGEVRRGGRTEAKGNGLGSWLG